MAGGRIRTILIANSPYLISKNPAQRRIAASMKARVLPGSRKASIIPAPNVSASTPIVCRILLQSLMIHLRISFSMTLYAVARQKFTRRAIL